jgi:hypothetical protein
MIYFRKAASFTLAQNKTPPSIWINHLRAEKGHGFNFVFQINSLSFASFNN